MAPYVPSAEVGMKLALVGKNCEFNKLFLVLCGNCAHKKMAPLILAYVLFSTKSVKSR